MEATQKKGVGRSAGYTMVEVMAALLVFGVGLLGIMALQVASTRGNMDSQNVTTATAIAEWWMERLRMESLMWNRGATDITAERTPMLFALGAGVGSHGRTTGWIAPPNNPRYDRWMRVAAAHDTPGEFCSQYRLTTVTANELLRGEVRVMWWRSRARRPAGWTTCPTGMLGGDGNPDTRVVHSITISSLLWRHNFM